MSVPSGLESLVGPGFAFPPSSVPFEYDEAPSAGGPISPIRERGPWCEYCGHEHRSKKGELEIAILFPVVTCSYCGRTSAPVKVEPFHQVSKSQLEKFSPELSPESGCNRRYFYKYVLHLPEPKNPAAEQGIVGHEIAENYMLTGALPVINDLKPRSVETRLGKSVQALIPHIPLPTHPTLEVEAELRFEFEGVHYLGYTDYRARSVLGFKGFADWAQEAGYRLLPGETIPLLGDHKFTSDTKWALLPEDLAKDVQAVLYSHHVLNHWDPDAPGVFLNWVYAERGKRNALPVRTFVHRAHIEKEMRRVNAIAKDLIQLRLRGPNIDPATVPGNPRGCKAYGQDCPHLDICPMSAEERLAGSFDVGDSDHMTMNFDNDPFGAIMAVNDQNNAGAGFAPGGAAGYASAQPQTFTTTGIASGPWNNTLPEGAGGPTPPVAMPAPAGPVYAVATGVNPPPANPTVVAQGGAPPMGTVLMQIPGYDTPVEVRMDQLGMVPPGSTIVQRPVVDPLKAAPVTPVAPAPMQTTAAPAVAQAAPAPPTKPKGPRPPGAGKGVLGRPPGAKNKSKPITVRAPSVPGGPVIVETPPGTHLKVVDPAGTVPPAQAAAVAVAVQTPAAPAQEQREGYRVTSDADLDPDATDDRFELMINAIPTKIPDGFRVISGAQIVGEVSPAICKDHNVYHYKAIDFGKGPGMLLAYLDAMLRANPLGRDVIVTVDTRTQEGADIAPFLERHARRVSRGS